MADVAFQPVERNSGIDRGVRRLPGWKGSDPCELTSTPAASFDRFNGHHLALAAYTRQARNCRTGIDRSSDRRPALETRSHLPSVRPLSSTISSPDRPTRSAPSDTHPPSRAHLKHVTLDKPETYPRLI